jgi:hypothetical protein
MARLASALPVVRTHSEDVPLVVELEGDPHG